MSDEQKQQPQQQKDEGVSTSIPYGVFVAMQSQEERLNGKIDRVQGTLSLYVTKDDLSKELTLIRYEMSGIKSDVSKVSNDINSVQSQIEKSEGSILRKIEKVTDDIADMTRKQSDEQIANLTAQHEEQLSKYKRWVAMQAVPIMGIVSLAVAAVFQHFFH